MERERDKGIGKGIIENKTLKFGFNFVVFFFPLLLVFVIWFLIILLLSIMMYFPWATFWRVLLFAPLGLVETY
jgi:hypothetical protein